MTKLRIRAKGDDMTPEQLSTLKAAILAETDVDFVGYRTNGQTTLMAAWFNVEANPAIKAWRTSVPPEDSDEATPWANFDSIAQAGKRDSFLHAFMRYPRNYARGAVRKWITDVWGNATVGSNAGTILITAGQRNITRGEAVLGGSTQASTNAVSALKLAWEGSITDVDISAALARP